MNIVEMYLEERIGMQVTLSNGWWQKFRLRHKELTVRTAEHLAYSRAIATDQDVMDCYFSLLEQTLVDNNILNCPSRIFNVDETGFSLNHKPKSSYS